MKGNKKINLLINKSFRPEVGPTWVKLLTLVLNCLNMSAFKVSTMLISKMPRISNAPSSFNFITVK